MRGRLRLGRFFTEWCLLLLLVGGGTLGLLGFLDQTELLLPVGSATAVVALAELATYILVGFGLLIHPARFLLFWGGSMLGKFWWFLLASFAFHRSGASGIDAFLLTLGIAFHVWTFHSVLRLVQLSDAHDARTKAVRGRTGRMPSASGP